MNSTELRDRVLEAVVDLAHEHGADGFVEDDAVVARTRLDQIRVIEALDYWGKYQRVADAPPPITRVPRMSRISLEGVRMVDEMRRRTIEAPRITNNIGSVVGALHAGVGDQNVTINVDQLLAQLPAAMSAAGVPAEKQAELENYAKECLMEVAKDAAGFWTKLLTFASKIAPYLPQ